MNKVTKTKAAIPTGTTTVQFQDAPLLKSRVPPMHIKDEMKSMRTIKYMKYNSQESTLTAIAWGKAVRKSRFANL